MRYALLFFVLTLTSAIAATQSPRGAELFKKKAIIKKVVPLPPLPPGFQQTTIDTNLHMTSIRKTNATSMHIAWSGPTGTVFQLLTKTNVLQSQWTTVGSETTNRSTTVPINTRFSIFEVKQAGAPQPTPGQLQWVRDIMGRGGIVDPKCIACDHSGNTIVAGYYTLGVDCGGGVRTNGGQADMFIAKYSPQNGLLWDKVFAGGGDEVFYGVTVDSQNNVIVTGSFYGTVNFGGQSLTSGGQSDIAVVKYSPAGGLIWAKRFGSIGSDSGRAITVDTSDNVVLAVQFSFTVDFGTGPLVNPSDNLGVVKLRPDGSTIWAKRWGTTIFDRATSIAIDRSGDVLVTGQSYGPTDLGGGVSTSGGAFVAKYSSVDGNYRWAKVLGGTIASGVASDPATSNVIATGDAGGTINFGNGSTNYANPTAFLVSYDTTGSYLWSKTYTTTLFAGASGSAVSISSGNLIFAGQASGAINFGGGATIAGGLCLASFTITGNSPPTYLWNKSATGSGGSTARGVAFDGLGHVVATGIFSSTTSFWGTPVTPPNGGTDGYVVQVTK